MRTHGKITRWNDERGFGFITPAGARVPDYVGEALKWFDTHLRPAPAARP